MPDLSDVVRATMRDEDLQSYREAAEYFGISHGSIGNILNRKPLGIDTLSTVAEKLGRPLWEVMQLAGIDLGLPKTTTERAQRLAALLDRAPGLYRTIERLQALNEDDPDYVAGMIVGLEASITARQDLHPPPEGHTNGSE
jgi:transcriptional regulator with XRE-family HTH domain